MTAPPRAPGELADRLEAIIDDFNREYNDALAVDDCPHVWDQVVEVDIADLKEAIASLRSATGDGGEAKGAGAPFTPNYSAVAEPEYRYQEPDNRACSMAAQPRSTKIEGAGDNA